MLLSKLILSNSKGYALSMALGTLAIITGLTAYIMQSSDHANDITAKMVTSIEADELIDNINLILGNKNNCRLSLSGENFYKSQIHSPSTQPGLPVEIWTGDLAGTSRLQKRFTSNTLFQHLKLRSLNLYMTEGTSANYPSGQQVEKGILEINYERDGMPVKKKVPLTVSLTTNGSGRSTISDCKLATDTKICSAVGLTYNSTTGTCYEPEICEGWTNMANPDLWSGEREHVCSSNPGGYAKSIRLKQQRDGSGDKDMNGLEVQCCYPERIAHVNCTGWITIANPDLWSGERDGFCNAGPGGKMHSMMLTQERDGGGDKDMNGLQIRCCYPK